MTKKSLLQVLIGIIIVGCFYTLPVDIDAQLPLRGVFSFIGLGLLGAVVMRQIRLYPDQIGRLVIVFLGVTNLLALACYAVAIHYPGEFTGINTRTDALYFAVTTISTVGYGDIAPQGQIARSLVTVMIVFNVFFLGALISAISQSQMDRNIRKRPITLSKPHHPEPSEIDNL